MPTAIETAPGSPADSPSSSGVLHSDPPSTAEKAVQFAERGFYVFPCKPEGKAPATPNGFKSASNDPERVRQMFAGANFNIGFVPGLSGHVVVDVDTKEGAEALRELWGCEIPETVSWETGRGAQYLFRTPLELRSRTGVVPGVDVRANGGYAILPPSVHPNGKKYTFHAGQSGKIATLTPEQAGALGAARSTEAPPQRDLRAPSPEELAALVRRIPNTDPDRDAYIKFGCAVKAAGGDDAFDVFAEWCARWEGGTNDPGTVRRDWDGMHAPFRLGWGWLVETAQAAGYNPAQDAFEANPEAPAPEVPPQPTGMLARIRTASEMCSEERPPVEYVLEGTLALGRVSILAAGPKTGKSTITRALAVAGAKGEPWCGLETTPGRVLYLALEEHRDDVQADLEVFGGTGLDNLDVYASALPIASPDDELRTVLEARGPYSLIIVDTLFRPLAAGEGQRLHDDYGCPP